MSDEMHEITFESVLRETSSAILLEIEGEVPCGFFARRWHQAKRDYDRAKTMVFEDFGIAIPVSHLVNILKPHWNCQCSEED